MAVDTTTSIDPNRYALQQAQQARQLAAEQAAAAKTKMQDSPAVPYRAQAPAGATPDLLASKFVIRPATLPGREVPVPGQGSSPPSSHPAPKPGDPGFIGPVVPQAMAPPDERPAPGALEPFRRVPSSIAAPDRTGLGGPVVLRVQIGGLPISPSNPARPLYGPPVPGADTIGGETMTVPKGPVLYVLAPSDSLPLGTGGPAMCSMPPAAAEEEPKGNRWMSALEALGGVAETVGGVALTATGAGLSEFGIGVPIAALGVMVTADGAQRTVHGLSDTFKNESTPGYITQGLTGTGVDPQTASRVDAGVGVVGAVAGGGSGAVKLAVLGGTNAVRLGGVASAALTVDGAAPGAYYAATGDRAWTPLTVQGLTTTGLSETQANYALTIGGLGIGAGGHLAGGRNAATSAPPVVLEPARVSTARPGPAGPDLKPGDVPQTGVPRLQPSETLQRQDGASPRRVEDWPRDEALGTHSTMEALLANPLRPGRVGVVVTDADIRMGDIYKLSEATGVEYALAIERVDGQEVFKLYSGHAWASGTPAGTHVAHTHPNPNEHQQYPSRADMESATTSLDRLRTYDSEVEAPEQYIIWGSGDTDYTGYYGGPFKTNN